MAPTVAKVRPEQFELFLRRHGTMWDVAGDQTFEEFINEMPLAPDEFVASLGFYFPDSEFLYVYSDIGTVDDLTQAYDLEDVPEVDSHRLDAFIIRAVHGADFLYFAPTKVIASNGTYLTLLPWNDNLAEPKNDD